MLRVTVPATVEPVTLDEAKAHLRVDGSADDLLISGMLSAAREVVEQRTGYALAVATYEWSPICRDYRYLPIEPGTVLSGADAYPVVFSTAPGPVPAALRAAVLLITGDLYANREAGITGASHVENPAVDSLTFPFRRILP